ncbi:MAG: alpha-amylase [Candidatus Electrothrix sp. AX2]|nr:alpha-amylase [Candidatus Electrothrix gigas]
MLCRRKECHPVLYVMNVRVQLTELTLSTGRTATLNDIPEGELDRLADFGVDFLWLIGVWHTGDSSRKVARDYEGLQSVYKQTLSDFSSEDVLGSPYAIAEYSFDSLLGDEDQLLLFRERLSKRGIRLILDFIVNHTGLDHRWVYEHPEYYIQGKIYDIEQAPNDFFQVETSMGRKIIAHGKDPFFSPWTDTAQLNLSSNIVQEELRRELLNIAKHCDGVRCDMAMLSLQTIIQKTWGDRPLSSIVTQLDKSDFWDTAIREVKKNNPDFIFIAEAYWDTEYKLRTLGFDYTYDKTLHNRLIYENGRAVYAHLKADVAWQEQTVRFLENHDEERAAHALSFNRHVAAAVIFSTLPGMLLIHDGQFEGRKIKHPVQLRRRCKEPVDKIVHFFMKNYFIL